MRHWLVSEVLQLGSRIFYQGDSKDELGVGEAVQP